METETEFVPSNGNKRKPAVAKPSAIERAGNLTVDVVCVGATPLLMHRFAEASEIDGQTRAVNITRGTPREEAEKAAYRLADGALYLPGAGLARLIREAAGSHKQRGSRKSMKYIIGAAVLVLSETLALVDADGKPLTEFEVDSRPVVIPSTKGRVMRHRPRLDQWGFKGRLKINQKLVQREFVHQIVTDGGEQIGLGDYRPEKGGPYGTFRIVRWDEAV